LSPRYFFNQRRAVLDGATGMYNPDDPISVKKYIEGFGELGLPSRE
jgi:hypothetical protein